MGNILGKVFGFLVVGFTLLLSPVIYSANSSIVAAIAAADNDAALATASTIIKLGAIVIILGLLFSGGLFAYSGVKNSNAQVGRNQLLGVFGSVIGVVILLSMFPGMVITPVDDLITTASIAGDTTGASVYPFLPILAYIGIMAGAAWSNVAAYKSYRGGRRSRGMSAL